MHLFYVPGGGWGHGYRVATYIRQQGLDRVRVIGTNPAIAGLFTPGHFELLAVDEDSSKAPLQEALRTSLAGLSPEVFYTDTFPMGIMGELEGLVPESWQCIHLARRMNWEAYAPVLPAKAIHYARTLAVEPLQAEQLSWLSEHSNTVGHLLLDYPAPNPDRVSGWLRNLPRPLWLIVHTSNADEVESLLSHAADIARMEEVSPFYLLISDMDVRLPGPGIQVYDTPACDWFPHADRIFCGGGFNTLQQVRDFAQKTKALPFPRRFDNQAERIGRVLG